VAVCSGARALLHGAAGNVFGALDGHRHGGNADQISDAQRVEWQVI